MADLTDDIVEKQYSTAEHQASLRNGSLSPHGKPGLTTKQSYLLLGNRPFSSNCSRQRTITDSQLVPKQPLDLALTRLLQC